MQNCAAVDDLHELVAAGPIGATSGKRRVQGTAMTLWVIKCVKTAWNLLHDTYDLGTLYELRNKGNRTILFVKALRNSVHDAGTKKMVISVV